MSLLALFNWSEKAKPCQIRLKRYGLKKSYHLFDFFDGKYLGKIEDKAELGWIPPRGVRYFALAEISNKPQIIGLDFHLGAGTQGAKIQKRANQLRLELELAGSRAGKIWLSLPRKPKPTIVEIGFENKTNIKI